MNFNDIQPENREFRTLEFAMLPVGKTFYQRKPFIGSEANKMIKIATAKTASGAWANAKVVAGGAMLFVQYDTKIVTEK